MSTLHLGVIPQPYRNNSVRTYRGKTGKPGKRRKAHVSAMTTLDVARILEAKYHIMDHFFDRHTPEIVGDILNAYMGGVETALHRGMTTINYGQHGIDPIRKRFNDFLDQEEMAGLEPGVPTQAALHGVSHRFAHPYARRARRPSFIDTGLYENTFWAWVD